MPITRSIVKLVVAATILASLSACVVPPLMPLLPPVVVPPPQPIRPAAPVTPLMLVPAPVPFPPVPPVSPVGAATPAPYDEVVPRIPFAGAVWIAGHCSCLGGRHHWEPGGWEAPRPGYSYRLPA